MSFAVISPSTGTSPRQLLGREDELRWLTAGLRAAERGVGALIAVEGAAGIGKSSMLREAQRRAEEMDMVVLATRAVTAERLQSYALARRLWAPVGVDPTAGIGELARAAGRLAAERSVLIAVDDVDRCDTDSLRALAALALQLDDVGGVALLVARRYDAPWCSDPIALDALVGDPGAIRIRLGPLAPADAAAIIEAGVGATPEPGFATAVHRLTAGNPFLVSELTLGLGEHGIAPIDASAGALSDLALAGVARSVRARAGDAGDRAEPLLDALAALGDDATLAATAAVAGLSYMDAADRCGELVTAGVLAAYDPPQFAQPLLRQAIYETIAPGERLRLHGEAARALAAAGAQLEAIARHILVAAPARDRWAARTLQTAALAARARGAIGEACEYLERALTEGVNELEPALESDLGLALAALGDACAGDHLTRAYELAGSTSARAELALALARLAAARGEANSARRWCLAGLELLSDSDDPELLERLRAELGETPAGEPSSCLLLAVKAEGAARSGHSRERAIELARRALSSREVWHEQGSLVPHMAVEALVAADHLDEADLAWEAALAASEQRGSTWDAAAIRAHRAGTLLALGTVEAAIENARAALAAVGETAGPVRARAVANLAEALLAHGEVDSAAAVLADARDGLDGFDPRTALASARVSIAQQRHADALAELEAAANEAQALGIENPAVMPWRSLAAECHLALGDRARARELAAEEVELATGFGAPRARARALRALAHAADGEAALAALRDAADLLQDSRAELELAGALLDLGEAVSRTEPVAARDPLRRAMAIAHRCGASALAARARNALIAAGGRPRRPVNDGVGSLTRAERCVAELAAVGRTNREIGEQLYITLNTVSTHLRSVYRKLNISSRAQLPTEGFES